MYTFALFEFNPFRDLSFFHWGIVVLIALGTWIVREVRERSGQSWPIVNGTIESATVLVVNNNLRAEVRYSYTVDGEYYSGLFFRMPRSATKGEELLARFPKDSRVLVHYKPSNPENSVLDAYEIRTRLQQPIPTNT